MVCLQSSAGGMPVGTGSCSTGVGCKHPVIFAFDKYKDKKACDH